MRPRRSPAFGFAWLLWRQRRRGLSVLAASFAVLALLAHSGDAVLRREDLAAAASIVLMCGLFYLIAIFTGAEADIAATGSAYPPRLWILPVRTISLVFWPMLFGSATIALTWIAFACLVIGPLTRVPVSAYLWWPAVLLVALTVFLQALFWSNGGLPYARVVGALIAVPAAFVFAVQEADAGVSFTALSGLFVATIPLSFFGAVAGVSRARHGSAAPWTLSRANTAAAPAERARLPFRSAFRAQLWYEWRRTGLALPLVVVAAFLFFSVPLAWVRDPAQLGYDRWVGFFFPGIGGIEVNLWVRYLLPILLLPIPFSMVVGSRLRDSDSRSQELSLQPFLAVRPMTGSRWVAAKLGAAALSALAAWAVALLFGFSWFMTPARFGTDAAPLLALLWRHRGPETAPRVAAALVILVLWTWRNLADGLFVGFSGRQWIRVGYPLAVAGVLSTALYLAAWMQIDPWAWARLLHRLPALATIAAVVKLLAAAAIVIDLARHRWIAPRALAGLAAAWIVIAFALFAVLARLFSRDAVHPFYLALGVVLFLPLTRIAAAPLFLERNRHR